ncbi:4-hydroxy-tetrahydrodipicolinate synthase [Planctomycetes bacterium Pan216]|uniref:4-hydroxy-tetrahydrodipicolinate synthase n=1 Tax=Kolteria novifilia TaxID=2527975 RepID=A0A518AZU8_9BACT|nr:4-hydroxy-tetrahydrodipicolinate synthase [Planctomycetes bacterium Pan216]
MSSATNQHLHGVLPVLHTPLTEEESIDVPTLQREVDWAFEVGADGVVIAMVSEITRLGYQRRRELAEHVCRSVGGRGFVVVSVGAESTRESIELARHAEALGVDAVMAIPPVTTRLGGTAVRDYFAAIARSVSVPLLVQDASSYVGMAIDLGVYVSLLDEFGPKRIQFKPEASPLGPNLSRLRDATDGSARIFEGSGGINLVDCHRRGIVGTMPGTDLLDAVVALWRALESGDEERIYRLSLPLSAIVALQLQAGLDGFVTIEKYLLHKRGIFPHRRLVGPAGWEIDDETAAEVDRLFDRLQAAL